MECSHTLRVRKPLSALLLLLLQQQCQHQQQLLLGRVDCCGMRFLKRQKASQEVQQQQQHRWRVLGTRTALWTKMRLVTGRRPKQDPLQGMM